MPSCVILTATMPQNVIRNYFPKLYLFLNRIKEHNASAESIVLKLIKQVVKNYTNTADENLSDEDYSLRHIWIKSVATWT